MYMSVKLEIQDHDGYIHAIITGKCEFKSTIEAFDKILEHSGGTRIPNILIDSREMEGKLSGTETIDFATETTKIWMEHYLSGKIRRTKIAFLNHEDNYDPNHYGEKVASARGVNFVLTTTNFDDAMEYLGIKSLENN